MPSLGLKKKVMLQKALSCIDLLDSVLETGSSSSSSSEWRRCGGPGVGGQSQDSAQAQ